MIDYDPPKNFMEPRALVITSEFGNINGGYMLVDVDVEGFGTYFNDEDSKYLYYMIDFEKWFVSDKHLSTHAYCVTKETKDKNPINAKWDNLKIEAVDLLLTSSFNENHHDERFVDPDFAPNGDAVGEELANCTWVRAAALQGPGVTPKLFDCIEPVDICQGSLGDCWLLAAISAVAEFPSFIENQVFVTKEFNPEGVYTLRLYDCKIQAFVEISVDSLIPCQEKKWWEIKARPLFAQPNGDELYILILEKAFAKFAGGYQKLDGGFPCLAWLALTGCEDLQIWKREDDEWKKGYVPIDSRRETKSRNFQSLSIARTDVVMDDDAFFEKLVEFDLDNFLMGASIGGDVIEKSRDDGLVERHAYSLLSAKDVDGTRLIELRNPWGNDKEWNGDWCDSSPLWDENEQAAYECGHVHSDAVVPDGRFWMSYEDFITRFTSVQVSAVTMPTTRGTHGSYNTSRTNTISENSNLDHNNSDDGDSASHYSTDESESDVTIEDGENEKRKDIDDFKPPSGFQAPMALAASSRFSNIDGGYMLIEVDKDGYGVYEDSENSKYLYYLQKFQKWFISDEIGSTRVFCVSNVIKHDPDPVNAKWDGLIIQPIDLDHVTLYTYESNCFNERYIDPDFTPDEYSLGHEHRNCTWVRAAALQGPGVTPKLFDCIEPVDICQGSLGDCWLLAAISAVAEFPNFIEQEVFLTKEFNPEGVYYVRLYDCQIEEFVEISVDSLIPCQEKKWWEIKARPLFAQPKADELYILILEKAFAKFAGGYHKLDGGFPCLVWLALTGCEDLQIWKREDDEWKKGYVPIEKRRKAKSRNFQKLSIARTDVVMDDDAFFEKLVEFDLDNFLMGASIGGDVVEKSRDDGLVEGHVYSLLSAKDVDGTRLIELRNLWGNSKEWNGDWCDSSPLWDENEQAAYECGHAHSDEVIGDGRFWMSYEDFITRFTSVQVCAKSMPTTRGTHRSAKKTMISNSRRRTEVHFGGVEVVDVEKNEDTSYQFSNDKDQDNTQPPENPRIGAEFLPRFTRKIQISQRIKQPEKNGLNPRTLVRELVAARRAGDDIKVRQIKKKLQAFW